MIHEAKGIPPVQFQLLKIPTAVNEAADLKGLFSDVRLAAVNFVNSVLIDPHGVDKLYI